MTYHFVVEHISSLNTVEHLAFLLITHTGHHGDGLVQVSVEDGLCGVDFLYSLTFEGFDKLG